MEVPSRTGRHRKADSSDISNSNGSAACDQCRARKIRCNRQQPKCLNCIKAGSECIFSGRLKRINHTRKLVDDFSSLETRLESIDQSMAAISRRISTQRPSTLAPIPSDPCESDLFSAKSCDRSDTGEECIPQHEIYRSLHRKLDSGCERYYGSTAALSLLESSRRVLGEILDSSGTEKSDTSLSNLLARDRGLKADLQILLDSYPLLNCYQEQDFHVDGKVVSSPPRSYINSVIDAFWDTVHVARPVFTDAGLKSDIEQHNAGKDSEPIEATRLCFNNIIVLALGLKLRHRRRSEPNSHGMDDDLLLSFLKNSSRAFGHLKNFLEPCLRNVQALITLAMVAREYWDIHVFEQLCHMACHVAKSMGLHRLSPNHVDINPETSELRSHLFWTLYIMDKERAFMTGVPCDLYFFDSEIQLHEPEETGVSVENYAVAHNHIMSLWEDTYRSLYSSRAVRSENWQRSQQVSRLHEAFRSWGFKYKTFLRAILEPEEHVKECFQIELKYCFHVGQILIHQSGTDESSKEQRLNSMYCSLNLIQDVYKKSHSFPHVALLGRLFHCYPSIAFIDLYNEILISPASSKVESDVTLLTKTVEALSLLKDPNSPRPFYSRLHVGVAWCVQVARRVMESMTASPKSPPKDATSAISQTATNKPQSQNSSAPSLYTGTSSPKKSPMKTARTPPFLEESQRPHKKSLPSPVQILGSRAISWQRQQQQQQQQEQPKQTQRPQQQQQQHTQTLTQNPDTILPTHPSSLSLPEKPTVSNPHPRTITTKYISTAPTLQHHDLTAFPFLNLPDDNDATLSTDFFNWDLQQMPNPHELSSMQELNNGDGFVTRAMQQHSEMAEGGEGSVGVDPWDMDFGM